MKNIFYTIILLFSGSLAICQQRMVLENGAAVVLSNGTSTKPTYLVVADSNANAIVRDSGYLYSENEFNMLQWNIGANTGNYVVPFGDSNSLYLPLTLEINSNPGTSGGSIKFSTYHTPALNSGDEPSDVTNLTPFILPGSPSNTDNSYNIADRFFIIDANTGYTTKPAPDNITFSYISGTVNSEVSSPNTLTQSRMMAQRFNSTTDTWTDWFGYGCSDAIVNNIGTVQTGPVPAIDMYRSWSLWDNTMSLPLKIASVNASSGCSNNGSATATVYGGKSPYTYSWSNGNSAASISSLSAGTYTVTARDAGGCNSTSSVTITQPTTLSVTAAVTAEVTCYDGNNGNATATISGGTTPYTYSWSNGTSTVSASNPTGAILSAGTYTVTAMDKNGCNATAPVSISQPAQFLYATAGTVSEVTCNGFSNGHVSVSPVGGNSPYTFKWSNGITTVSTIQSPTTLSAGTYTVTVTDNCGVSKTSTATITQPGALRDSAKSITNVGCYGGTGGSITLGAKGGSYPYSYSWSSGSTLITASNLSAGAYSVVITDTKGCTNTVTGITITQPTQIISSTKDSCTGNKMGIVTVTASGGVSPYTYKWSNAKTTTTITVSNGTYTVTVKDSHGCSETNTVTVSCPSSPEVKDALENQVSHQLCCDGLDNIRLYPNPTNGQFTITGLTQGMVIEMYDYTGREINPQFVIHNSQCVVNIADQPSGIYLIRIFDKDGNFVSSKKVVKAE